MRRILSTLCVLALLSTQTGCFGSFLATRKLWAFNKEISSNKFVQWLVFLGMVIIPVYALFTLADALVLNSLEFWTDSNPLAGPDAPRERTVRLSAREVLFMTRDVESGAMTVEVLEDGRRVLFRRFVPLEDGISVTGEDGVPIASVSSVPGGGAVVLDARGAPISIATAAGVERFAAGYARGGASALAELLLERRMVASR